MTTEGPPCRGRRPRAAAASARPSRRALLTGAAAGFGAIGLGAAIASALAEAGRPDPVRSVTAAYTRSGVREALDGESARDLPAGSRVMPNLADPGPARRQQEFLDQCEPWLGTLPAHRRELGVAALLDLWVLSDELPAAVAGWVGAWRYIWPRDAAFVSVALARVGMQEMAWRHLRHLQAVQAVDGSFAARVDPGTGMAPDDRESQFDSLGLVLWAISEVTADSGTAAAPFVLGELDDLLRRTSRRLFDLTAHGRSLPPVGPDYWEVGESQVTLGLAGPTLVGMNSLAVLTKADGQLWSRLGGGAETVRRAVEDYRDTFARTFGANGMQRYPTSGGSDSSIAYLPAAGLVPDATEGIYALESDILAGVWDRLEQPAGGIKPGHGWIIDRSSWTPSTSLMGLGFARLGRREKAESILDWLSRHRTGAGSLPEKISDDGTPASVAPLSWTAANVIITLDELYGHRGGADS
ncbi:hypothetical protein [Brevibacterium sp. CFH 10365]|uniref:hypothetical protein n=1 Tax=Brevibacterium sp. CFH 10365 TaxID=2585207 RepID=UPI001266639A|nr:hypothetical protein [Brevibacterium sp. CFH 10365]